MQTDQKQTNPRVFITGATGVVGSHLISLLLSQGYSNIIGLRRASSRLDLIETFADRIEWIEGDILDIETLEHGMEGASWVLHCAALISYDPRRRKEMHQVNVTGTRNVVNTALFKKVSQLLHISSIAVFTRTGKEQIITEKTPWQPTPYTSHYGLTKYLAEMEAWRAHAEGLPVAVINPSVILGGGYWKEGSVSMMHKVWKGLRIYPTGTNGYVDVRDVARAAVRLMEERIFGVRYIINGHNKSYKEVFGAMASIIGARPPSLRIEPWLTEIGWRALEPVRWIFGELPLIAKETVRTTSCKLSFNNQKSSTIPGFHYTPFDSTVADMAEKFLAAKGKNFKGAILDF